MTPPLLLPALLLLALPASHAAGNCDTIRAQIDTKIRSSGVVGFTLQVVDAESRFTGKVVGSCDLGTKRIVYHPSSAPARARPGEERILTECKDGSVTYGECSR